MKLNEGIIGHTYRVEGVAVNETITRRLEALGVNSMTPVTLLNKKGSGSVIFKVLKILTPSLYGNATAHSGSRNACSVNGVVKELVTVYLDSASALAASPRTT